MGTYGLTYSLMTPEGTAHPEFDPLRFEPTASGLWTEHFPIPDVLTHWAIQDFLSSARRQKGLTSYYFKYVDRPFCLRTDALPLLLTWECREVSILIPCHNGHSQDGQSDQNTDNVSLPAGHLQKCRGDTLRSLIPWSLNSVVMETKWYWHYT